MSPLFVIIPIVYQFIGGIVKSHIQLIREGSYVSFSDSRVLSLTLLL